MTRLGEWRLWRRLYLLPLLVWALSGVFLLFADRILENPLRRQREADFRAEAERVVDALNRAGGKGGPILRALVSVRTSGDRLIAEERDARVLLDTDRDSSLWLVAPEALARGVEGWRVESPPPSPFHPRDAPATLFLTPVRAGSPVRVVWARRPPGTGGPAVTIRRGLMLSWLAAGILLLIAGRLGIARMRSAIGRLERLVREPQDGIVRGERTGAADPEDDAFDLAFDLERMRRRWENELASLRREQRERASIFEGMPEGLIAIDGQKRLLVMNSAACRLLSVTEPAPIGARLPEVVRVSDLHRYIEARFSGRPAEPVDLDAGGGLRTLQVRGTPLSGADGRVESLVLVLSDVTDVRRLEQIRKDFVDNVSHELKTPLTNLRGYVETLLDGAHEEVATRLSFLRTILRNAERMQRIVEDLLNLSRIESTGRQIERQPIRPREVIAHVLEEARPEAEARNVRVLCEDEVGPVDYAGNLFMLERALSNLVDNAIKYGGQGKEVRVRCRRSGDDLLLEVIDQGSGIPAAHLGRLFERFYRIDRGRSRELGGTGLGLALVKHVALAHGGEATVASEPGRGSTFTMRLPWTEGDAPA